MLKSGCFWNALFGSRGFVNRHIIMLRRLIYFQQILHQRVDYTMLYQLFKAHLKILSTNDLVTQVLKELERLESDFEITEIEQMEKEEFSKLCKWKVRQNAFDYLQKKKNKSDNRRHIKYSHLKMQSFRRFNCKIKTISISMHYVERSPY